MRCEANQSFALLRSDFIFCSEMLRVIALLFASGFALFVGAERTLNATINPGCFSRNCQTFGTDFTKTLVYVVSSDSKRNDTLDYRFYWSMIGAPTFLINEVPHGTPSDAAAGITWPEFIDDPKPDTQFFSIPVGRYAGITLMNFLEFEDTKNTGKIEDATNFVVHHFSEAQWYNVSLASGPSLLATFKGTFGAGYASRNITIELRAYTENARDADPPKMQAQIGSMTMRIILDNADIHWEKSRFAVEVIYASNDASDMTAVHTIDKSISDEFTPGVFTMERVAGRDTFMAWRPVVYTAAVPGVSDSTRSRTGPLRDIALDFSHNATEGGVPYSLLLGLNGSSEHLTHFNISFGQTDDDFYNATRFQEWSCQIGIGQPLVDQVSSKIKLIIGIGFGLPAALILIGGLYIAYVKIQKRRRERSLLVTDASPNYESLG